MPSNLPPITQNLLSSMQQMRSEQLASLSKITGLSVGSTVMAVVEQIAPATQSQRDLLLAQSQQLLAQLQQKPATPAIKLQIATLLEQQQLLASPPLKLVQLQLNNRPLLTYTDQPVQVGQQIPVKLDTQQRLVQLLSALSAGTSPLTTKEGEPDLAAITKAQQSVVHTAAQAKAQSALAEALRTLLPQKEKPQELLAALAPLQQLPIKQRDQLLPTTVQQALRSVADQLRSMPQLTNPKLLPMVLKNSGVQFEQKLAANLSPAPESSVATKNPVSIPTNPISQRLISQDYKGALLHLLNQLGQALGKAAPPMNEVPSTPLTSTPSATSSTTPLPFSPLQSTGFALPTPLQFPTALQLLQHLAARPNLDLSDKVLRTQLMLLLHQHTLTSLAKVQLQQLHTLNHQQSQVDSPQPTQSWLFDIPVRYGQDVHPLEIRIDQEWVNDEKNEENPRDKVKQWSVMLSFNLPRLGGLYAQLTILDDAVSAKLWAEQASTLAQAQASLDSLRQQLQSQGVDVKQLQCVTGPPPSRSVSLNYALVDIQT
ncbi:flagellar hook-length control protein FliK [Cellvibrio sp. PSBB006]|uniref:flagellar hook-length control protein FliK n=1 Tax=Cellvibrio sp. PSBB006 TaxID=1987723 RepID=UPI0012FC04C9|nr:flagellar hook-length control protein FliK [Cellvibrio sp. PSBB006]